MPDERPPLEDGYEYTEPPPSTEIRLIDPEWCPRGHPLESYRRSHRPCAEHGGHPVWYCPCGQEIFRHDGAFVDGLLCR